MMGRWLRFNAAGVLGVSVQLAVLYLLTRFADFNYLFATIVAVELAVLHNFLWHEKYTWRIRTQLEPRSTLRRLMRFNLSNGAVSMAGNVVLMRMLVQGCGLSVIAANVCTIAVCSTFNFVIAEYFVFAAKPEANDGGLFV